MTEQETWNDANITIEGDDIHYIMQTEDSVDHCSIQYVPGVELPQLETRDKSDVLQSHTLMIREGDNGQIFGCLNCKLNYASALEFKTAHNIDVEEVDLKEELEFIEEPLWETVPADVPVEQNYDNEEDIILEELVEDTTQENVEVVLDPSDECYSCLQCGVSFNDLYTAETHVCEVEKTSNIIEDAPDDYVDITDTVLKLNRQISQQKEENDAGNYTCEICNISFRAERYLM